MAKESFGEWFGDRVGKTIDAVSEAWSDDDEKSPGKKGGEKAEGASKAKEAGPADASGTEQIAPVPVTKEAAPSKLAEEERKSAAAAKKAGEVVEKKEVAGQVAAMKTSLELGKLQKENSREVKELILALGLEGKSLSALLPEVSSEGKLERKEIRGVIAADVERYVASANIGKLKEMLKRLDPSADSLDDKSVKEVLSSLFSDGFAKKVADDFRKKYPLYADFTKGKLSYTTRFSIKFDSFGGSKVEFKFQPGDFEKKYKEFTEKNPDKKAEAEAEIAKENEVTPDIEKKIKLLKKKPLLMFFLPAVAGFLNMIGSDIELDAEGKLTEKGYAQFISSEYGGIFLTLCGGGSMVEGNPLDDFMKDASPKTRSFLTQMKTKLESSPLSLTKLAETTGLASAAAALTAFSTGDFGKLLEGGLKMPEGGFKLTEMFEGLSPGKGLEVALKKGSEMILPQGESITFLDGAKEIVKKATDGPMTFASGVLKIKDKIPSGTVFKGLMDFNLIDLLK